MKIIYPPLGPEDKALLVFAVSCFIPCLIIAVGGIFLRIVL